MARESPTDAADPEIFLTAYDPTDLPGTSVDPLGFERAYLFLADKILPGLTNVVGVGRYFSVFCAGILLADVDPSAPARKQVSARRDAIMRLERMWALANLQGASDEDQRQLLGIRGIRYVQAEMARLQRTGELNARVDFKLLARQGTYGVLGIYGAVAEGMHLVDRSAYTLTPGMGDELAQAFIQGTRMPSAVRKAVAGEATVRVDTLADWGRNASVLNPLPPAEARTLREALFSDPVRHRMCELLIESPSFDGDDELTWMTRLASLRTGSGRDQDLADVMSVILAFERCYQLSMVVLTRLMIMCRLSSNAAIDRTTRQSDRVMIKIATELPLAVATLDRALSDQRAQVIGARPEKLEDTLVFLRRAAESTDPLALADMVLRRHSEVQRGKFDGGRRKLPWMEEQDGALALTPTRVPETPADVQSFDDMRPHAYRMFTAQRLLVGTGSAAN
jgi:hypothetical protein